MVDAGWSEQEAHLTEQTRHLYTWVILALPLDAYDGHA